MRKSVEPAAARELLFSIPAQTPKTEVLPLTELFGRVCAKDIFADISIPPFDRSPFDGYALRGEDTADASPDHPVTLTITEEVPAGGAPTIDITPGFATKILTGAPMPKGANATVKYELTAEYTKTAVTFTAPVAPGSDVIKEGEDLPSGTLLIQAGEVFSPSSVGLLACVGRAEAKVFCRPVVAVLCTGNELVAPGDPLPFGKIYNSGIYTLIGALRELGMDAYDAGTVNDDPQEIADRIAENIPGCDAVITTGGASVGDYDFAGGAAERLQMNVLFWKTKLKPGGAMLASEYQGKLVLALAGNPASALIGLLHIAAPFLLRLAGRCELHKDALEVHLKNRYSGLTQRTRLLRGFLEIIGGKAYFTQSGGQNSSVISSFQGCDLFGEIPPNTAVAEADTLIKAFRV
jgi:molybdopterin molybdotransferase